MSSLVPGPRSSSACPPLPRRPRPNGSAMTRWLASGSPELRSHGSATTMGTESVATAVRPAISRVSPRRSARPVPPLPAADRRSLRSGRAQLRRSSLRRQGKPPPPTQPPLCGCRGHPGWSEQEFLGDGAERRSWQVVRPGWMRGPTPTGRRGSGGYPPEEPAAALPNPPNPPNPPAVTPAWVADTVAAATVPSAPFVP